MPTFRLRPSLPHGVSLVVWLALGFSATAWVLRAQSAGAVAPAQFSASVHRQDPDNAWVAKALGAMPAVADNSQKGSGTLDKARFVLAGVIAQGQGKGAALIAVDGKPAKPFAVGATVVDGWVLSKVERLSAWMAPDKGAGEAVELPLVPIDSKKPLAVAGVTPAAMVGNEPPKPSAAFQPLTTPPGSANAPIRAALGGTGIEPLRNAAVKAEAAPANKGD